MVKSRNEYYKVSGKITNQPGNPLSTVTVSAYDKDFGRQYDALGEPTQTDAKGNYTITFAEEEFRARGDAHSGPDLFIKVHQKGILLRKSSVTANAKRSTSINLTVPVEDKTVPKVLGDLTKLGFDIPKEDIRKKTIGKSSTEALKAFQKKNKLKATGKLDDHTIATIDREVTDEHYHRSKTRIAKLHQQLERVGYKVPKEETSNRKLGPETRKAIEKLQKKSKLPVTGKLDSHTLDEIQNQVVLSKTGSRTQVSNLQKTLLRGLQIARVDVEIDPKELADKEIGPTTREALKIFQNKYNLPSTGELDSPTLYKLESIANSKGSISKKIKQPVAKSLKVVTQPLSINKSSAQVTTLQNNLAHLGYKIDAKEFNTKTYGKTTRKAVLDYQKAHQLPQDGHFKGITKKSLNAQVVNANPEAVEPLIKYRIKGSVRDELHHRTGNTVLHIYEKLVDGISAEPLMTKKTHSNGFFDIIYVPPIDPITGTIKKKFHLLVRLLDENNKPITEKILFNVSMTQWVNFNLADEPYQGDTAFYSTSKILQKAIGQLNLLDLKETNDQKQITQLSIETGLSKDEIMRMILAHHVAQQFPNEEVLSSEVFYALIKQNLPANLPGDLLRATNDWETFDQLIELATSGIVFTNAELLEEMLTSAIKQNLVPLDVKQNQQKILSLFAAQRTSFTLNKPILIGNASLMQLLNESKIPKTKYEDVSQIFISSKGINEAFWEAMESNEVGISSGSVQDFKATVGLGSITKNHFPTISFLKSNIGTGNKPFKQVSDVAKLSKKDIAELVEKNDNTIPDYIPGENLEEKIATYAEVIHSRAEFTYPLVSLLAKVKKGDRSILENMEAAEKFIDQHSEVNLRYEVLDKFLAENNISLDDPIKEEVKLLHRIGKLTTKSAAGQLLIENGLHSSATIYGTGKTKLINLMNKNGVDRNTADKIYEQAKTQYAYVIAKLTDYLPEIHYGNPKAISDHTYTQEELKSVLGDIPNLEALFGSMDFCACEHCKSLYGPAAYFTDLLRFLKEQNSLVEEGSSTLTVKDILFDRRPDLGNIKLNCENTNTPLPYIDLTCEILENHISPQQRDFDHQTTLSAAELRAIPQYIRPHAYETLAAAEYPMYSSFNLWQTEARTYLSYLRVERHELMAAFQNTLDPSNKHPNDASIAAEFFGISSKEAELITTKESTSARQKVYWDLSSISSTLDVSEFLDRFKLTYNQLIELLEVQLVNDPSSKTIIQRPDNSCDVDLQQLTNITATKLDLMHRFIRLWKKTGWKMWELDLLLRNSKIGNEKIDEDALIRLKKVKELQLKSKLPADIICAFYEEITTDNLVNPEHMNVATPSLYHRFFQSLAVTNPTDDHFALPLDNSILLGENTTGPHSGYNPTSTILSALAISQKDFDIIKPLTDNQLSLTSLSILLRYSYLARSLKMSVKDLMSLLEVIDVADPFSSLQSTLDCIAAKELISQSSFSIIELDYILRHNEESPYGLREESLVQMIEAQRNVIIANEEIVAQLNLSNAELNTLQTFDADALGALSDPDIITTLQPLKNLLEEKMEALVQANLSVQEVAYIVQYLPENTVDATLLISHIKTLQNSLAEIFDTNNKQVLSHIANLFGLTMEQAEVLLQQLTLPGESENLSDMLSDKALLEKDPDESYKEISSANFPKYFKAYILLHKVSLLIDKLDLDAINLEWFIEHHSEVDALDLEALPIDSGATNQYEQWENLVRFLNFQSAYPEPEEASLIRLLDLAIDSSATKSTILEMLSIWTQWSLEELETLDAGLQLAHAPGTLDYADQETLFRLQKCFAQMNLTGVSAATMLKWADRDNEALQVATSLETRNAIKSKYEHEDWLKKITPLQDKIRDKKREALVAYLLEHSQRNESPTITFDGDTIPNPLYWKDSNALYKYLLIDVEMSSCQLTSRIKQAISSVQLFVQRCFLNLESRYVQVSQEEKDDEASENAWSQWKWMKVYRIWEANRKVFFYPENWIEPELRDDKSPFFLELENEILQSEINHENVEEAFRNYLHKVDEVSNLEICGLYHEMEDLNLNELGYEINNIHVVARTKSVPPVYYYRKYDMNYSTWTAWEKVEVDIEGDQLVPVVYNRRVHLFWLVFMEKAQKISKVPSPSLTSGSGGTRDTPEPRKMYEIQLGWSVKKEKGWTAKKISKSKMIHPWERPKHSYNLKPHYKEVTNELWMDIYISTSKEFNDHLFYDPVQDKKVRLSKASFNETYKPWHSSSFVFNGEVKELNLRGLDAPYYFNRTGTTILTDSYEFVHGNFGEDGEKIKRLSTIEDGPRLTLPNGMHYQYTQLTNNQVHLVNNQELRILDNTGKTETLLRRANNPFQLAITLQDIQFAEEHPMFYQDSQRSFFIKPEWQHTYNQYGQLLHSTRKYRFLPNYHPYTALFIRELNRDGIDGLLKRKVQTKPQTFIPKNTFHFNSYQSTDLTQVDETALTDRLDFTYTGAYSIYNWETFFHAPMLIANKLMQNQRFEEAMRWYHYIFDPTNTEALTTPQRYWVTKPFYEYNSEDYRQQRIENILADISSSEHQEQLKAWRNNPFMPHLIARYRPVAYQRNVVMKYLDNLIAWGDQLFRRDSIESINEASLLYMLAYEILGDQPTKVARLTSEDLSFNEIEDKLDEFGNATVDVLVEDTLLPVEAVPAPGDSEPLPSIQTFYFCIPNNNLLLKYWDTIEDRLFKIRHCMNIEGVVRSLALFEPPIDPALLVKAAAAGVDLSSVLNDLTVGTPYYRFHVLQRKAVDLAQDVKYLGEKLLTALEKKDIETLSLMRSNHEIQLLEAVKDVRKKQIEEADESILALNESFNRAEERRSHYADIPRMNDWEVGGTIAHGVGIGFEIAATITNLFAGTISMVPDGELGAAGVGGSPQANLKFGGTSFGNSAARIGSMLEGIARISHATAGMLETQGSYHRNYEQNQHQVDIAELDKKEINHQIAAANIRQAIATKELSNHELQIDQAKTTYDFMRNKYTNEQLYSWMISQISTVYFQSYQLAYDLAKKAEKCYHYELGTDSTYIQFGYWDSLKKGLLSGDRLLSDLRKLDAAFTDDNRRELELTRHISLAQLSPLSLMKLKETGRCEISLPEWLFNMDYPGHYNRRIKSVSLSIPCVVGPYVSVNCTLSLVKSTIRVEPTLDGGSYEQVDENDTRFTTRLGAISSIATSHAQGDSGMFQLDFHDERYLPFELMGAVSDWIIELPQANNRFDFDSITDLILQVNYTAKNGGNTLAEAANTELAAIVPNESVRIMSLKHDFSNNWHQFLYPTGESDQEFVMELKPEHYPFIVRNSLNTLKIRELHIFVSSELSGDYEIQLKATSTDYEGSSDVSPDADFNDTHHTMRDYTAGVKPDALGEIRLKLKEKSGVGDFKSLDPDSVEDIILLIYTGE